MADNFTFTPGVGGTGSADDIGGVLYPRVKITDGTADSNTPVNVDIGVKANALRVVPANDITDATYIGDIKFGEAEPNSAAILTALEIIDDWDESDRAKVNTIAGQVGVQAAEGNITALTQRVTLAQDDDAVASLGIIDDWDATHASAASADGPQIMGAGYSTGLPADVGADADATRICTDRYGRVLSGIMPQAFQATFNSADAQAASPVKAKTASRKMYILSLVVSTDTEMNVQFQDDTGPTVLIENLYLAANGGWQGQWPPEAPLVVNTNEDFDVITSAAGNISVTITGYLAV